MITALVGASGVLLGVAFTGLWNFGLRIFDQRQLRRVAARAVVDSLRTVRGSIGVTIDPESSAMVSEKELEHLEDTWREHRVALATLPLDRWTSVEDVVALSFSVRRALPIDWEGDESSEEFGKKTIKDLDEAIEALEPYVADGTGRISRWVAKP